jgi:hypothetical protein
MDVFRTYVMDHITVSNREVCACIYVYAPCIYVTIHTLYVELPSTFWCVFVFTKWITQVRKACMHMYFRCMHVYTEKAGE